PLDAGSTVPLYRQVYTQCCASIAEGLLKPGDRLPSARALAIQMGIARGTGEKAYSLLTAEGYTQTPGSGGTLLSPGLPVFPVPRGDSYHPGERSSAPQGNVAWNPLRPASSILPLQMGLPAMDMFPRKLWSRVGARHMRTVGALDMAYPPAHGSERLRS